MPALGPLGSLVAAAFAAAALLAAPAVALAQDDCASEAEPNDAPETATTFAGPGCYWATLPDDDQDLWLWAVTDQDARTTWTFDLRGVPGTLTSLKILGIDSEPGVLPLMVGGTLAVVDVPPGGPGSAQVADLLLPVGWYVLGVSRSGTQDQSVPTSLDYELAVRPGRPLPAPGEREPNDDTDRATPVTGEFELSGDLEGSYDRFRWTVSDELAAGAWDLTIQGPIGAGVYLALADADGRDLAYGTTGRDGTVRLVDLRLPAGPLGITLGPSEGVVTPYAVSATWKPEPEGDPEPNDRAAQAAPIDAAAHRWRGILGRDGDRDYFGLHVDDALSGVLFDLRLLWRSGLDLSLCLQDATGLTLKCGRSADGVALEALSLPVGDYVIEVTGEAAPNDPYLIRLDEAGPRVPDFEAEPNDGPDYATPFDASVVMRARFTAGDRDVFRVTVTGDAQLWMATASGRGIGLMAVVRADGLRVSDAEVNEDRTQATLNDLYLIPGVHWIEVFGEPGEYTLALTALGPPDPNAEREPNNSSLDAGSLAIDQVRLGRLTEQTDDDVYRFSLTATERVTLRVTPPPDASIDVRLVYDGADLARLDEGELGAPVTYDALLLPGDYEVWLWADPPSDGTYRLTLERGDPLSTVADQEPNDQPYLARPLPATLRATGSATGSYDEDWYRIEPLPMPGPVTIHARGDVYRIALTDGLTDLFLTQGEDGTAWISDPVPEGVPLFLGVTAERAAYEISVELPGVTPGTPPGPLPVLLSLDLPTDEVAAFWPAGQVVSGSLTVTSTGTSSVDLELDAVASHHAWSPELDSGTIEVAAGATAAVPVRVVIPADATGGIAVRVTVRGRDGSGAQVTAFADVTPTQDAEAVSPQPAWGVPSGLVGGLDVASLALGAVPDGTIDAEGELELHDGVTPSGRGLSMYPGSFPLELTVDLAGDDPMPIAGTMLDLQGNGGVEEMPRDFELLLSTDGVEYAVGLSGELLPVTGDQAFVLDHPTDARFARLRITSHYGPSLNRLVLGEWKVVAAPGAVPITGSLNIGDPGRGGHVVFTEPMWGAMDAGQRLLSEDRATDWMTVPEGLQPTWVVGFQDDRAAQVTGFEWVDPEVFDPVVRFRQVDVAVSMAGPLGPWQRLGTWKLTRRRDGSVPSFGLDAPTWARFVRFVGDGPRGDQARYRQPPATLRILERPTDDEYRSVLAEWGQTSPAGPYELLHPPEPAAAAGPDDNDTFEAADPFPAGVPVSGRVHIERDVDWFAIDVPEGQNSLVIEVEGVPTVGVSLTLVDAAGTEVPMTFGPGTLPGAVSYAASVTPGVRYGLRVQQPPFSAIVTFDTSGSMGAYYPFVVQGVRAFTAAVERGREAVNLIPFEEDPLLPSFSDEPFVLQDAIDRYTLGEGSSGAEQALIDASKELADRQGARAILVVTDAETSTFDKSSALWKELADARPTVFSVHVGGDSQPAFTRHLMQDWSAAGDGVYQYARSHGEVDRAFDRMAAWLRRPAAYELRYHSSTKVLPPPDPGSINVRAAPNEDGSPGRVPVAQNVAIELVLDTSGSMLERLGGSRRIDVAKRVLAKLVREDLPAGTAVALRQFTQRAGSCDSELAVPLGPLDPAAMARQIEGLTVLRSVNTPLAEAIDAVGRDLAGVTGPRVVVVVSDGEENCGGDPAKAVRRLVKQGFDLTVNVVGLGLDPAARKAIRRLASLGKGTYFDARDPDQLDRAVTTAVSAPYQVFDVTGALVGSGTVNGAGVRVPPGTYRVVVLTRPEVTFETVVVESGKDVALTMPVRTIEARAVPSILHGASARRAHDRRLP